MRPPEPNAFEKIPLPQTLELSVVAPVRDEAGAASQLAREIAAALDGRAYEIVFVDDCSRDDTRAELAALKVELPGRQGQRPHGVVDHGAREWRPGRDRYRQATQSESRLAGAIAGLPGLAAQPEQGALVLSQAR
jgi:glycosyltransferase involved in cell wall biosynthesis